MSNNDYLGINIDVNTIAICMAVYNGEKYLPAQLDSILNQTFKNWILFVRDDGSTDLSSQILKDYCEKYPKKIINVKDKKENSGGARQNFARILKYVEKFADFQYYMFSDQDDIWLPEKLEKIREFFLNIERENRYEPILVHTDLKVVDAKLNVLGESFIKYRAIDPTVTDLAHVLVQNNITGCTMMWNRALNEIVQLNDERIVIHDWWFALAASAFGKIAFLDEATILYRQHEKNVIGAVNVNTLSFIIKRLFGGNYVRKTFVKSVRQAKAFAECYRGKLADDQYDLVQTYAKLYDHGKIKRIEIAIKNKFLKQGFVQVIGEILFI